MIEITKVQFNKFVKLQNSGIINMNEVARGSFLIKESHDVYKNIILNYAKLKKKYND